eukprot:2951517-Prymnesium_polylepis.1
MERPKRSWRGPKAVRVQSFFSAPGRGVHVVAERCRQHDDRHLKLEQEGHTCRATCSFLLVCPRQEERRNKCREQPDAKTRVGRHPEAGGLKGHCDCAAQHARDEVRDEGGDVEALADVHLRRPHAIGQHHPADANAEQEVHPEGHERADADARDYVVDTALHRLPKQPVEPVTPRGGGREEEPRAEPRGHRGADGYAARLDVRRLARVLVGAVRVITTVDALQRAVAHTHQQQRRLRRAEGSALYQRV